MGFATFNRRQWALTIATALGVSLATAALAAEPTSDRQPKRSVSEQLRKDIKEGRVKLTEGDETAVQELIIKRNIPIKYDYINTLMRTPNAFGTGAACVTCHYSADEVHSYRGLDLSTCEGIRRGSTEEPKRAIFTPGEPSPNKSILGRRMRNNRMPLGVSFATPHESKNHTLVNDWIANGAKDDENFRKNVLPLFKQKNAFGANTPACTECHMSNQEPPSFHELDLTSHPGIMLGADSVAKGVDKATKVIVPGKPEESSLFQHLVEDRMPPGISPTENRDHPNTQILMQWVRQGAKCD